MRLLLLVLCTCIISLCVHAQKKVIDHSVYDGWEAVGERSISNNGKFVVYAVNPQEGDGNLIIQASDNSYKKQVPRGYGATITEDSRFVIFKIRPLFKDVRDARIKKKTPPEMPKDSLAIIELGKDSIVKIPSIRSFRIPEEGSGAWVAYLYEKNNSPLTRPAARPDSITQISNMMRMADSLSRIVDSIRNKANEAKTNGIASLQPARTTSKAPVRVAERVEEGTELVLRNLHTGAEKQFFLVNEYLFNKTGTVLLVETSRKNADSVVTAAVIRMDLSSAKPDTIFRKFNDARSFVINDDGTQLAFIAERDSAAKAQQKFYKLYYYRKGMD
ncbi:MAG: S9 family peptidase, partial [Chitinophagaceae bacterium]